LANNFLPLNEALYFYQTMRIFFKLVLVTIIATSIGLIPWIMNWVIISEAPINLRNTVQLVAIYLVGVLNGSMVVFCIGSPLYLILFKYKLVNYLTVTVLGGLTLLINNYEGVWSLITLSGLFIAPLYHFYFNKFKVMVH
jgi:hypothetical protein